MKWSGVRRGDSLTSSACRSWNQASINTNTHKLVETDPTCWTWLSIEEDDGPPETASNTYNHNKQPTRQRLAGFREQWLDERELTEKQLY